jgi:hypothetical protein
MVAMTIIAGSKTIPASSEITTSKARLDSAR